MDNSGILYVVSSPIGNLEDLSYRAKRILQEVSMIAAEDTRRTAKLMAVYGIENRVTSLHSHNISKKTPRILEHLEKGGDVALVSDSGTPGISDPGTVLIAKAIEKELRVTAVPGPAAFLTALVLSGKPTNKFVFEGFLSNKSVRRKKQLECLAGEERTVVLYESPHRILKFLRDASEVLGERELVIARELTKKFEEIRRGTAEELLEHFTGTSPRGEFVVVF